MLDNIQLELIFVITFFSFFQSIFGVGILVFGTPTLLLMGWPVDETFLALIPSSMMISLLQVVQGFKIYSFHYKNLYIFSVPSIAVSLWVLLENELNIDILFIAGSLLILVALARENPFLNNLLRKFINSNVKLYHTIMGLVHGFTNLGGGLLSIMAASSYKDKSEIRYVTAFYYFIFGIIQLSVLIFYVGFDKLYSSLYVVPIAFVIYVVLGNKTFLAIPLAYYGKIISCFLFMYGVTLFLRHYFIIH